MSRGEELRAWRPRGHVAARGTPPRNPAGPALGEKELEAARAVKPGRAAEDASRLSNPPVLRAAGTVQARSHRSGAGRAPSGAGATWCGRAPGALLSRRRLPPARTRAVRTKESLSRAPALPRPRPSAGRGVIARASGSRPAGSPAACPGAALHLFILVEEGGGHLSWSRKIFPGSLYLLIFSSRSGFKCRCVGKGRVQCGRRGSCGARAKCSQ